MPQAIIIEDNPAAEKQLRAILADKCPDVEVIYTAASVVAGAKILKKHSADLLFLDIELPDGTGFDLLDIIDDWPGGLIFTTGLDDQALKAFRYAAVDYLVKPIAADLLKEAVNRAMKTQGARKEQHELLRKVGQGNKQLPDRIALHSQDRIQLIAIKDIIRLEAESNYTSFFLNNGKRIMVGKTLKNYAKLLEEHQFLRVHQSHLVNPLHITEFIKTDGGYLLMNNGNKIPVSVRRRTLVVAYFSGV